LANSLRPDDFVWALFFVLREASQS